MAYMEITATNETDAIVVGLSFKPEVQTDPDDEDAERFRMVLRLVTERQVENITAISGLDNSLSIFSTVSAKFSGGEPETWSTPSGFGSWRLMSQALEQLGARGSNMSIVTEEYVAKAATWTALSWA